MLTLKRAKATRCDTHSDRDCKCWHRTCRRCELHGLFSYFNNESKLCNECYKEYRGWYQEEILNPAIKAFDAEKEAGLDPDWSPFWLGAAYAVWMKQAPHRLRAVYTIQGEVLNMEDECDRCKEKAFSYVKERCMACGSGMTLYGD